MSAYTATPRVNEPFADALKKEHAARRLAAISNLFADQARENDQRTAPPETARLHPCICGWRLACDRGLGCVQ